MSTPAPTDPAAATYRITFLCPNATGRDSMGDIRECGASGTFEVSAEELAEIDPDPVEAMNAYSVCCPGCRQDIESSDGDFIRPAEPDEKVDYRMSDEDGLVPLDPEEENRDHLRSYRKAREWAASFHRRDNPLSDERIASLGDHHGLHDGFPVFVFQGERSRFVLRLATVCNPAVARHLSEPLVGVADLRTDEESGYITTLPEDRETLTLLHRVQLTRVLERLATQAPAYVAEAAPALFEAYYGGGPLPQSAADEINAARRSAAGAAADESPSP